jgi:uncharacterized membrane protein YeaQ/YmgE (transglycosylase-associated protein family)
MSLPADLLHFSQPYKTLQDTDQRGLTRKNDPASAFPALIRPTQRQAESDTISASPKYKKETHMNFIVWIIFGALAGWIASIFMKKNAKMGAIANIIVGIIGAFVGGYIMNFFGFQGVTGFNLPSLLVAIIGAIVLLFIVGLFTRR